MDEQMRLQVWEGFCTLSDAQELIGTGQGDTANEKINHAKLHLMEVLKSGIPLGVSVTCSLGEGVHTPTAQMGLLEAAQAMLTRLENLTTDAFSKGGEKQERERLLEEIQGLVPGWQPTELGG